MCQAAEITKNQMAVMCEDEDKTVPTVIKKRNAQGSTSKGLRNLKTPSGKAKTSTESKTRGGSDDHQANSIQGAVTRRKGARASRRTPIWVTHSH